MRQARTAELASALAEAEDTCKTLAEEKTARVHRLEDLERSLKSLEGDLQALALQNAMKVWCDIGVLVMSCSQRRLMRAFVTVFILHHQCVAVLELLLCLCSRAAVVLQPDGQVDVTLARKKRRLNAEFDSLLDRLNVAKQDVEFAESRCSAHP